MAPARQPPVRLAGIDLSNPSKIFWPDEGISKLDLARFYCRIARHVLPWLKERAVTMERCPEGIRAGCFYQKQAPRHLPAGVPTVRIPGPTTGRQIDYVLGGSLKTLLTLVNLGCIALHVANVRIDRLEFPDWMAFDLDPTGGMPPTVDVARLLKEQLEDHGLESFVKTSGGRGLHVFVPLRRGAHQDAVRAYAAAIAGDLARTRPDLVTVESRKAKRRAPVYLDVSRNASGQTIVPPYSVRWRPGAPVSTPLEWREVTPRLDPSRFNVTTAERRFASVSPWAQFFRKRQTLPRV